MQQGEFEKSIKDALAASANAGSKWRSLEKYFSDQGLRGSGALNNDPAERRTRVRQLLTTRKHPGFDTAEHSRHCVYVVAKEAAKKLKSDPLYLDKILQDLRAERPESPPDRCMETVLIFAAPSKEVLEPVRIMQWGASELASTYESWYPGVEVITEPIPKGATVLPKAISPGKMAYVGGAGGVRGENVVYFGPPGTGKSHRANADTEQFAVVLRTVFHPEYSYAEFVGTYKPLSGSDPSQKITAFDGVREIARPVIYYSFEPGVLVNAIATALAHQDEPVALIIEEINRGDCAAIFGDFLQLLDRADNGRSQYGIRVAPPLGRYLADTKVLDSADEELFLPANLFIVATMNTSDQSLYPMDAAFKRRWNWVAVPINYGADELEGVAVSPTNDPNPVLWIKLIERINIAVVQAGLSGDKRIGPWYIRPVSGAIPSDQVRNKLLFYLWHDVFREQCHLCFNADAMTFDDLQSLYDGKGLTHAMSPLFPADSSSEQQTQST